MLLAVARLCCVLDYLVAEWNCGSSVWLSVGVNIVKFERVGEFG